MGASGGHIFYGEVCVLSALCKNAWQLFSVERGEDFLCEYHEDGFRNLVAALRGEAHPAA